MSPYSLPYSISHMNPNPNLTGIYATIKGTVEEILKKHHQQTPTNIPVAPVHTPSNRFENKINPIIH